jgi:hypothetical protein
MKTNRSLPVCLFVAVIALFAFTSAARAASWTPPIGIPTPPFGINEVAPATPNPWTTSTAGFYYVDATKAGATDSSNTYGTPAKPRLTIPYTLPAGSVVELHGTYSASHSSPATIVAQGTSSRPVFIRGVSPTSRPLVRRGWEITGTYLVIENIEFGPMPDLSSTGGMAILLPSSHIVVRNNELHGTPTDGGVGLLNWEVPYGTPYTGPGVIDYVVIYNNSIHDNGDVNATYDQDVHGISIGDHVNHSWVVDNQLYRNSGDGIQINAGDGQRATTHHIYVGRNVSHNNKQDGFWVKDSTDVILSQNESYGHRPGNSSQGNCMGAQYAPDWVWFIYNHVHDCEWGIEQASDHFDQYSRTYVIGNVIHNIHNTVSGTDPASAWGPSAVMFAGGTERHVINNTIYDVDSGVNVAAANGSLEVVNNIIANVTQTRASHMLVGFSAVGASTALRNDLFFGDPRLNWGGGQTRPTAAQLASWKSLSSDPQFINPAGGDFHLNSSSPALGAGEVNAAYAVFQQRYGISIATDIVGTPRPATGYALGAYEKGCTASAPAAPQSLMGSTTTSTIALQWSAPASGCSGAATYILQIGSASGLSDIANASVGSVTNLSIPATGVPAGSYYFRVRAQTTLGISAPSNELVLTFGTGAAVPGAPRTLTVAVVLSKTVMTWAAPTTGGSLTAYILEAGSAPGLKDLGVFTLSGSLTVLSTAVPPRGTYYFRVRAQNSAGIGSSTNEAKLVVP